MPKHLDLNSAIITDSEAWNGVNPAARSAWGLLEGDVVKAFTNGVWCRDSLIYQFNIIAEGQTTDKKYPPDKIKPFAGQHQRLLYLIKPGKAPPNYNNNLPNTKHLQRGIDLVNLFENQVGDYLNKPLLKTKILETDNPDWIVLQGSKFWKMTSMHASLWTCILKTSMVQKEQEKIDLNWIIEQYQPTLGGSVPVGRYTPTGVFKTDLSWKDISPYMIKVLARLEVGKTNNGYGNSATTGIFAGFHLSSNTGAPYQSQIKTLLRQEMEAAGDKNAKEIPK